MAWELLNSNILTQFNNGTFEGLQSTWGSYTKYFPTFIRSDEFVLDGSYSGKMEGGGSQSISVPSVFNENYAHLMLQLNLNVTAGRRYKAKVRIRAHSWPNASNNTVLQLYIASTSTEDQVEVPLSVVPSPGSNTGFTEFWITPQTSGLRTLQLLCLFDDLGPGGNVPTNSQLSYIDLFSISEEVEGMEVSYDVSNVSVYQADDGAIDLTVTKGSGSYSYSWSDGPTTQDRSGLGPGLYTVTITDDNTGEEIIIQDIEVTEPGPTQIFATIETVDAVCNGSSTGAINLTSVSGADGGPYTFVWDDGPTTQNRSNIPAGTYSVTIEDGSSNTAYFDNIVVGEPTAIDIVATVNGQNISIAVSGGTPPYTYAWDDGPTTRNRTNLEPGDYTLTVTDANGCTAQVTVTVAQFRFFFTRNPVILELAAAAPETKPNLSFKCEVHVEESYLSGVFEKLTTLKQPAKSDGTTVFDVQAVLDGFEPLKRYLPAFNQSVMTRASSIFKRYYLRYAEHYGVPPVDDTFTEETVNYMVLGGLSYEEYASDYFFTNYLDEVKPFFTWQLPQKYVFDDQPEYLFFMVPQFTVTELRVKVDLHLINGTVVNMDVFTQNNVNRYEIYCIPAGFKQLLLDQQATYDLVDKWQVRITDQNDIDISQVRTYYMIHDYYRHRRYFLFRNSLGGMDTFCATGMAELKMRTKVEKIEKLLPHDYSISDGQEQITKKTADMEMDVNSGYLWQRAELERAQDFLKSEDVFEMKNGRYVPVEIEGGGVVSTDEQGPVSLKFTAIPPRVENYTPYLGNNVDAGEQPVDPEEYLLVNSTFLRINRE